MADDGYGVDMFSELRTSVPDTPAELWRSYVEELAGTTERVGAETVREETALDRETIDALVERDVSTLAAGESMDLVENESIAGASGDRAPLSLQDACEIAALRAEQPDAETILTEACEHLLLGMSTAVLDVETLATEVALDLEPKEIQQKLERRAPMSFEEFVQLQFAIANRTP